MLKTPNIIEVTDFTYDENYIKINNNIDFINLYFKEKSYIDNQNIFYIFIKTLSSFFDIDIFSFINIKSCNNDNASKIQNFFSNTLINHAIIDNFIAFLEINNFTDKCSIILLSIQNFLKNYNKNFDLLIDFDDISFVCNRIYTNIIDDKIDIYNFILKDEIVFYKDNIFYKFIKKNALEFNVDINTDIPQNINMYKDIHIKGSNKILGQILNQQLSEYADSNNIYDFTCSDLSLEEQYENLDKIYKSVDIKKLKFVVEKIVENIDNIKIDKSILDKEVDYYIKSSNIVADIKFLNYKEYLKIIEKLTFFIVNNLNNKENFLNLLNKFFSIFEIWNNSVESFYYIDQVLKAIDVFSNDSYIKDIVSSLRILFIETFIKSFNYFDQQSKYEILNILSSNLLNLKKSYIKLKKSDLKYLADFIKIPYNYIQGIFSSNKFTNKSMCSSYENISSTINYIINDDDSIDSTKLFSNNYYNIFYGLTIIAWNVCRISANSGWKKDNIIIEYILSKLHDMIDLIKLNINNINPWEASRVLSVFSAYYNILIRYNIDNKKFDNEKLLGEYYLELEFIRQNKFCDSRITTLSKLIDEYAKIQNYYNFFKINKNIFNNVMGLYNKYISLNNRPECDILLYNDILEENIFDENVDNYSKYSNRYQALYEETRAFLDISIYYGKIFTSNKKNHITVLEALKNMWEIFSDDTKFKKTKTMRDVKIYSNNIGVDFVYKL